MNKRLISLVSFGLLGGLTCGFAQEPKHPCYEVPAAPGVVTNGVPRLAVASPRVRFARDVLTGLPSAAEAPVVALRGWRGERVQAQVVAESPAGFAELVVEPCVLRSPDGSTVPVRVEVVRYVTSAGQLVADALEVPTETHYEGVVRPLLISVDIPETAPAEASGELAVRVNGTRLVAPIQLTVEGLTLPPPAQWGFHLDLWQHPDATARWHDVPMWSAAHLDLLEPQMRRLAAMGQKTITATLIDEAWNAQTYDRFRSMVQVTRRADGSWGYDYTDFDRWVEFMSGRIGLAEATIHCYTLVPWSLTFPYYDEAQGRVVAPRMEPSSPEYRAFWGAFLTDFVAHLRTKGWLARTRLAMDERPDNLLNPALAIAAEYAPELKIVAACDRPSAINNAFDDVSYAYAICEQLVPLAEARRAAGRKTTFYVCCFPARPNTFTTSTLAESEWLPPMAARYGLDGFLRWAYQSWPADPFASQDYGNWPSGDTSLIYPGDRSSLRLEGLRNGIESYEKIARLRQIAHAQGRPEVLAPLEAALQRFTVARGAEAGHHQADLEALDAAIHAVTAEVAP